jgi:predicted glycosyl hydrolase (DUF1957 family)
MLHDHGLSDVVTGLRALHERGQIEFVGSGKFHPILPLIDAAARERSIRDNARTNGELFGAWSPRGFFPPEMCFSMDIVAPIEGAGHDWVILSGLACPAAWPVDCVHRIAGSGLAALFRDDIRSNRISFRETNPQAFIEDIAHVGGGKDAYVVTAMDAETYGHHIRSWEREFLGATYGLIEQQSPRRRGPERTLGRVRMLLPSEVAEEFPPGEAIQPRASSWSTTEDDLRAGNPYPLWRAPGNRVHALQWELVEHCTELARTAARYADGGDSQLFAQLAAETLEPALHSCQFWWASRRPMWDVPMVHRGSRLLADVALYASRSLKLGRAPVETKQQLGWRLSATTELRLRLERHLFSDEPL